MDIRYGDPPSSDENPELYDRFSTVLTWPYIQTLRRSLPPSERFVVEYDISDIHR